MRLLIILLIVVPCWSFRHFLHPKINAKFTSRMSTSLHRRTVQPSSVVENKVICSKLNAHALDEPPSTWPLSNSVVVSYLREVFNQHGLLALTAPALVVGAIWTYYVQNSLKNRPTIYECDNCGNQLRAPAGKARLVLDRPGFKCPRCRSNVDCYFDINGKDIRAAQRRARVQADEISKNKYIDLKKDKIRAAEEYAAMRAAAKSRQVENNDDSTDMLQDSSI